MKNGKRLTRKEKEYVKSFRLNPNNWLISKKTSEKWLLVHRETDSLRELPAP